MDENKEPDLISRLEAARMAGVSPETIDRWLKHPAKLTKYRVNGYFVRVDRAELTALITPQPVTAPKN